MVSIEPVESQDEEEGKKNSNLNPNSKPKPISSAVEECSTTTTLTSTEKLNSTDDRKAAAASGDASDGFETASDSEFNDNEGEGINTNNADRSDRQEFQPSPEQQRREEEGREQSVSSNFENVYSEDELRQKALSQANDAKLEGNKLFGDGQYEEALSLYETALRVSSEVPSSGEIRSICHANRAACFFKLGKYEDTIKECTKALELNPTYVKVLLRRGEAHEKLEHYEEAIADLTKILEVDPSHQLAKGAIVRLKPLADEKREKMKEEMIGKLKEMGNSILGRFGMSTDNFKAVKDPNSGSYSISFQR